MSQSVALLLGACLGKYIDNVNETQGFSPIRMHRITGGFAQYILMKVQVI